MKKYNVIAVTGIATILGMGLLSNSESNKASADLSARMEFRWNSPTDKSHAMPKWTKSAYIVNSTKVTNDYYTATAWGHSYLAGGTGNVDVSNGSSYKIRSKREYAMNNMLCEWYGYGNSAYIWGVSYSNNSAYGTWRADR